MGAAADPAAHGLPAAALGACAGEHGVFGGHPALAAALAPARHALGEGSHAQHACAAELDEHRALSMVQPVACHGDGAQLVGRAPVLAGRLKGLGVAHEVRLPAGSVRGASTCQARPARSATGTVPGRSTWGRTRGGGRDRA